MDRKKKKPRNGMKKSHEMNIRTDGRTDGRTDIRTKRNWRRGIRMDRREQEWKENY